FLSHFVSLCLKKLALPVRAFEQESRVAPATHFDMESCAGSDDPITRSQVAALLRRATALDFSHIYPVFCHPKGWRHEKNQFKNSIQANAPFAIHRYPHWRCA